MGEQRFQWDEDDKICPFNPHGNGYCKKEKCAMWDIEANVSECSIFHACRALCDISGDLDIAINRQGIAVYIHDGYK